MNLLQKFWDRHVVLLILTALFWAGNAVAGRIAIDDVSPFLLSFLRWFILLILLWTLYWKDIKKAWPHLKDRWLYLILMGGLGLAGFNLVFYKAAHYTTAVKFWHSAGVDPTYCTFGCLLGLPQPYYHRATRWGVVRPGRCDHGGYRRCTRCG